MILYIGAGLVFLALVLAMSMIGVVNKERRGVARSMAAIQAMSQSSPDMLKTELERPFAERVLGPLGDQLVGTGRKLVRADTAEKLTYRLNVAGNPPGWDANRIIGLKVLGLGVFGGIGFLYIAGMDLPFVRMILATALVAGFGYILPNVLLFNTGQKREKLIRNALPDALDLLTVSVEAGLGFDAAVDRVARNTDGPLAAEFARLLQEMNIGVGRTDAMRAMAERTSLDDLKSFCLAMVQADSLGIPIGRVLRIRRDAHQASPAGRGEGAAGAGSDDDPIDPVHPAVPLPGDHGPGRDPDR